MKAEFVRSINIMENLFNVHIKDYEPYHKNALFNYKYGEMAASSVEIHSSQVERNLFQKYLRVRSSRNKRRFIKQAFPFHLIKNMRAACSFMKKTIIMKNYTENYYSMITNENLGM